MNTAVEGVRCEFAVKLIIHAGFSNIAPLWQIELQRIWRENSIVSIPLPQEYFPFVKFKVFE